MVNTKARKPSEILPMAKNSNYNDNKRFSKDNDISLSKKLIDT